MREAVVLAEGREVSVEADREEDIREEEVNAMKPEDLGIFLKRCPRCGGDIAVTRDLHGRYFSCLQCGLLKDIEDRVAPVRPVLTLGREGRHQHHPRASSRPKAASKP